MSFICMRIKKIILISVASHLASLWNRGLGHLGNGLFAIEVALETGSVMRRIGHFRVRKTLTFKMRLGAQPFFWKWVLFEWEWKNHFHMEGWALTLVLKQRPGGTRKWPMALWNMGLNQERILTQSPTPYSITANEILNWAIASPEHSHGAIRDNFDPVLRGTILKTVLIRSRRP